MLKPGDTAPSFDLPCAIDGKISRLSLAKLKTELVLLFFYPRDFSFICPTEVVGFGKVIGEFTAEETSVVGASVDDADSHLLWARELGGVAYPLLADDGGDLARAYGIFDDREKVAIRATFIIDQKREIAFAEACPLNVGRSIDEMLRIVRALRTGQLCPADWKPGVAFAPADQKL